MEWAELGELCEIKGGGTPLRRKKEYWINGDIPWVKISDIRGKYVKETEELITKEGFNSSSVKMIEKGSLIYTIFATVGKVAILDIDATTNQAIVELEIINKELISKDYLFYFLQSIEDKVKSKSRGVAQNNINIGMLKQIQIPVPPIEIQNQFAKKVQYFRKTKRTTSRIT
jgi:type I restriction enzyme S subunit